VDAAYKLYEGATDSDMESGLLSLPGHSSHNKGMAIDSMFYTPEGYEVDVGAHFDHLDMEVNHRHYRGSRISKTALENRRLREALFLRAAFARGVLLAPLRAEFWHDQMPENREDLWRVLESAARCIGLDLLSKEDENLRRNNRAAFAEKWERWSYADFLSHWRQFFKGREELLQAALGTKLPPEKDCLQCYHGNFNPVYDANLRTSGKHLTD
jgi:hypothetical protein